MQASRLTTMKRTGYVASPSRMRSCTPWRTESGLFFASPSAGKSALWVM